jgi:uncharacterized protein (TIGR00251 family)
MSQLPADWKNNIGDTIEVHVSPKASANKIKPEIYEEKLRLRVYVTVAPEDGKANEAVIKLLAKELRLAKSSLTIVQGLKSRNKIIRIHRQQ